MAINNGLSETSIKPLRIIIPPSQILKITQLTNLNFQTLLNPHLSYSFRHIASIPLHATDKRTL
jgi:hypothetical protein